MKQFNEYSNSRKQGLVGLGRAIAYFTKQEITTLLPINDSQPYDLAIEVDGVLKKVQVKTTYSKAPSGCYVVSLRTLGGNQSYHSAKPFDNNLSDYLYILTEDYTEYLIPSKEVLTKNQLYLNKEKDKYIVNKE